MPIPSNLIDKSIIAELFEVELDEDGRTLFHDLLPEFKDKIVPLFSSVKEMIQQEESIPFKEVAFAAHKIAGSCGNIGLILSTNQAQLLEEAANHSDTPAVRHAFLQLSESLWNSIEMLENIFRNGLNVAA